MSSAPPPPPGTRAQFGADDAMSVVSAYGAFRLLLVLLCAWTFFAGFALLVHGFGPLSLGDGEAGERVAGGQMLVLAPIYGLLAWRRDQYRLMLWVPYVAQVMTMLAILWAWDGGILLFVISGIFLALLIYLWINSHPLGFFAPSEEEDDEFIDIDDEDPTSPRVDAPEDAAERARRYRRQP